MAIPRYATHQMGVVSSKIAIFAYCGRYIFRNVIRDQNYYVMSQYVVPQWLFIDIETDDQMTFLNNLFALNTVFRVESFSVDHALILKHDCFRQRFTYCQRQRCSRRSVISGDVRRVPTFVGVCW